MAAVLECLRSGGLTMPAHFHEVDKKQELLWRWVAAIARGSVPAFFGDAAEVAGKSAAVV